MSTTAEIQIAPLPLTTEVAIELLQYLFATTGTPTDYNKGSIIRTYSEAIGSVLEIESTELQAEVLQALVYSAYSAFGISPLGAAGAIGTVTFSTLSSAPLPTGQSVLIPVNTIVQTVGGIQFGTSSSAILASGTSSVDAPVQSLLVGAFTNVTSGQINVIASSVTYPLAVTNKSPTAGGADAESPHDTLTRFLAYVYSLGLCTPISVAAAVIGVAFGEEKVKYATVVEPWISAITSGTTSGLAAGFTVYVDAGNGTASTNLLNSVSTFLSSGKINGQSIGFRPAGVPFTVSPVNPVLCSVVINATAIDPTLNTVIQTNIINAVTAYFANVGFTSPATRTQITATVANASFGQLSSLDVFLLNQTFVDVPQIIAGLSERVIMNSLSVVVVG